MVNMSVKRMLATLKSLFGIGLIAPVALSAFGGFSMLAVNEGGKKDRRQAPAVEEPAAEEPAASPAPAAKGMQKTTVSAGTSITGTISSDGHVEMLGEMKGDIDAKGNVRICGQVTGNVQGNNIEMVACRVQGNVTASAILTMDGESVLVGDIGAARATINGRVKGNVTTREAAVFNQNAMLLGDVTSELVTIDQGAVIHGALKVLRDKEIEKAFENL
ncbi:polymer-forming cytoskeletal protein [Anaerotruncus massiliensis (ex Liu et al. 2021)]|uniref:Polymer-forming cytoskeletal protein n=3 Tax=Anaerotruncus TaxID=244127 RepID=A0A498CSW2_9FIRM|nr:polymer-forming cytoskeletal protein [Anaerotruncus massiliensis (ex Liu et al. 2021)]